MWALVISLIVNFVVIFLAMGSELVHRDEIQAARGNNRRLYEEIDTLMGTTGYQQELIKHLQAELKLLAEDEVPL